MHINQMRLVNYRNYQDVSPVFSPGINILYGNNGQGKTNLLESVFLMCRGYSHRSGSLKNLISFGKEDMFAIAEFKSGETNHRLSLKAVKGQRGWKFDGHPVKSFSKVQPYLGCIIFEPNDLEIIKGSPDQRRRFMNFELFGLSPGYRPVFKEFERIRLQRNALLKQYKNSGGNIADIKDVLAPWDEQLIKTGSRIYLLRQDYLFRLSDKAEAFYGGLAGTSEKLELAYKTNVFGKETPQNEEDIISIYRESLQNSLEADLERGSTLRGPHADDLLVTVDGHPARLFASQGQQRTAAISLKLAHIDLYKEHLNLLPVVLLDDILSELDSTRQKNILSVLKDVQTFITCTNPSFSSHLGSNVNKIHIDNGMII